MDAKTLLDWFTNAPEGSQPFYAIPEEGRDTLRSALRLAATLEGPEEACPETVGYFERNGMIDIFFAGSLEQRMYRALRALRECEERAGKMEMILRSQLETQGSHMYEWRKETLAALTAKGDGND